MPNKLQTALSTGPVVTDSVGIDANTQFLRAPLVGPSFGESNDLGALNESQGTGGVADVDLGNRAAAVQQEPLIVGSMFGFPDKAPTLVPRQYFEGTITNINANSLTAIVKDRTSPSNPDEEIEFDIDEVSPVDRHLVRMGARFYWVIGTQRRPSGQNWNVSIFQMQREPAWTRSAISKVATRARTFKDAFGSPNE